MFKLDGEVAEQAHSVVRSALKRTIWNGSTNMKWKKGGSEKKTGLEEFVENLTVYTTKKKK